MVVIKKRNNVIPVDFGEFKLEFLANDKSIKKMTEVGKKLESEGAKLSETVNDDDNQAFESLHDLVKLSWTEIFDENAFEKVYKFSEGTTIDCMIYLLEAVNGIMSEWEKNNNGDALKKYLGD
ncbi:hypothetical protein VMHJH2_06835 [Streptococcus uberis]|uniref:hypothetical protein n=1 Tax=Streptococcus uberis TaxID=1349 RepID=UPI00215025BE|nr:hypothetical protein [Streptococcus uberis]MCR4258235.1 hypothetical protein [Streptococcus uberis]